MKKKILSLFLALAMCLSLLPTAAFAADGAQDPAEPGEEILAPEQLGDPEKDPDPEQEGGPAGVSAPQTGAANSEIAVRATGGHSQNHTTICNTYGCTKHNALSWSAISTVDQLTSATGETKGYYLTTDLELTEPWVPTGTVNLCLSGHSITLSAGTEAAPQSVITVNSGVQLNISNCISVAPGGTYDGIYYGGPYIRHAENAVGPGITVLDGGTVELFGGDVTQNSDGVVVQEGGTLNVNSDISENTGAGVRVEAGGTLSLMSSGRILSNAGCGVDVAAGSNFTVSGGAEVRNNTKNGETCNVYLRENATITLSELSGAEIGVTVEALPDQGAFAPVTSDGKASRNDQNCITSDNTSYRVFYSTSKSNGNLVLDARPTPLHADHNSETFVNSLSSPDGKLLINGEEAETNNYNGTTYYELPNGNYYLEGDLTLSCGLLAYSTNVVLCLNGHNITVTGNRPVVCVGKKTAGSSSSNGEVTLTDCGTDGTLTHSNGQGGGVYVRGGTFIMRGGKISGNSYGVDVYQGNEFKIYGGEISGNKSYGVSLTPVSGAYSGNGNIYMTVGGTAKIMGNWENGEYNAATGLYERGTTGTAKNVLFTDKPFKYITVDSSLKDGAEIGVTIWKVVTAERDCVAVATCGTALSADATPYVGYFKSDSDAYKVWSSNNNVVIGVWNSDDQSHPVCGAVCNHKDASGKPVHNENIVWTPVSSATGLNNGDNIYLTDDITLTSTWTINSGCTVNLCLNGHTIKANGDFDAITLTSNTNTLNICDCNASGAGKGIITHAEGTTGSGVYMTAADGRKATVNMYGGTITGNTGHTVTVKNVDSTRGGGVYVDSNAQFYMHGGSITENTADVGGGVYYTASNSLFVSGKVNITDNKGTDGKANNVYVPSSSGTPKTVPFYIGDDGLDTAAEIGVRVNDGVIATGGHSPVAQFGTYANAASAYNDGNFHADNEGDYSFKVAEREQDTITSTHVVNLYNGLHEHPICGKTCTDGAHTENLSWTGVSSLSEIKANEDGTTAYYYLTQDVTRTASWTAPDNVVLCLNGYSIMSTASDTTAITVDGTFTLTDCNGSNGVKYFKESTNGRWESVSDYADGVITVNGGVIFHTAGGATDKGMSLRSGKFYMYGGTICGNSGGVYVESAAAMTVSGNATITGNAGELNYNIYLNGVITVGGEFGADAKIGVTTSGTNISAGNYKTVAQSADGSALTDDDKEHFESDMGYTPQIRNGKIVFVNGTLHEHPICGKTCTHAGDEKHTDDLLWEPLTYENGYLYHGESTVGTTGDSWKIVYYQLTEGNYYLPESITIDKPIMIRGNVNLCLNGNTLSTNTTLPADNSAIAFITVYENCTLTLCDCDTEGGGTIRTENGLHNGVETWYPFDKNNTSHTAGNFTMYGGTITGVQRGVRLCVETNGGKSTFKMYGGKITGTKRGVYINDGSIFEMYAGEITGNNTQPTLKEDSTYFGGGVVVDIGATFTMHGGTISNNNAYSGGGVYLVGDSSSATTTFNMEGGTITGNTTTNGSGGGVYVKDATFTMSGDAAVSNNTNNGNCGGGVAVTGSYKKGSFTMRGNSTISGNTAKFYGGGVYFADGTFTMNENAAITGNSAGNGEYNGEGGGVCVSTGTFNMTGGSITGNNVHLGSNAFAGEGGGGVYMAPNATMSVSGSVQIKDNWKNGTLNTETGVYENGSANNLYLFAYETDKVLKTVTIGGDLTGAKIGVTTRYTPEEKGSILIATGAPTDHAKFFTPDVTGQGYTITQEGEKLYLSAHTHHWKYENSSSAAIKVTCDAPGCNLKSGFEVTYTLTAPAEDTLTYDGNGKPATVVRSAVELPTGVTLPETPTISYSYKVNNNPASLPSGEAPISANTYTASITMGGVTASVTYTIAKANPKADDFTFSAPGNLTYDGSPKTATVTSTKIDASYVTVKYYQGETEVSDPTNAGTYTVKIDVTESGNYTAKADLTDENWAFTILKGTYNGTTTPKTVDIVKGRSAAQSGSLTVADFFPAGQTVPAGATITGVAPASGAIMASVTVNAGTLAYTSKTNISATADETYTVTIATTNYMDIKATLTFHPVEKQPQTGFKFENAAVAKTYGNTDFTVTATGAVTGSSVTYSNSNTDVATVDGTGKVTIKGAGTAKITATASATDDYAEATAQYTLTVSPKTLTADDLEFTANSTFTKEYDGTTNCTTATVQIKSVAKVNSGDALPEVKGAYAYDSKDATGATKVTFTTERTENTNYILPVGLKVENAASITKRVLTVGTVTATSKQYDGETDAEACIASVPLNGVVDGDSLELDTPTTDGSYYFTADFIDANAGQNKTINGTVVLYPNKVTANYTFKDAQGNETNEATFTTTGAIAKADSWALTPVTDLTIRYNNRAEQTYTPDWPKLLPAGQKWTYNLEDTKVTGSAVLADHSIGADSGVLTYQLSAGAENDTVTWTITASCNNYESFTLTVKLTLIARNEQTGFAFKDVVDGKVTKTYGDADFTVKATGANEYSEVTYTSSDENVAKVNAQTGEVTIVGAGTAEITAAAAETDVYASASASYTLTVNKLRIPVPTKGKNELEYTGHEQTYLPDGLDPIYCTIESNTATDVIAGGSWHNADVSLKDRSNTEWADGADSTAHRPYPFRITPKPVTVTALDKKITAGQPAPELTSADYTVTGLIGNDTLGGISLYYADPSDLRTAVTPDTGKAGTYAIVVTEGGTGSNNYAPTFVNGTLTIASRPSGGVVAVTYPVNVPGETERGSVSSNVKNASKGSTVTITVEPEDGFQLADLTVTDKDGNELPLTDKGDGKYTFTMPAGKVEVNATFAEKIETSPFADVSTDAYYYEAVKWAAEQGITGGVGGGLFAPDQSCTRAQIVTFLWRAAGSPEPKSMRSFSDVPEDSYYAKAVAWAVENGITVGTSATTFSPDATCTRAQGVTFLFRAAKASADGAPAFRDVAADAYYAAAVKWATDNSVTNGIGGGLFGSDNDCTRAQIVTFLWRLYAGK